jgi:pyruvate dehydrogenase E2 component (dihydrolipoamide acetyltransferase)
MAENIIMPQGGQDITEGRVVKWMKREGDRVSKGEVTCEVETEKATFEVEAPIDGVLLKIVVEAGKVAPIFSTIGVVGSEGEEVVLGDDAGKHIKSETVDTGVDVKALKNKVAEKSKGSADGVKISGRAMKLALEKGVDISEVIGSGPNGRIVEKDILAYGEKSLTPAPAKAEPAASEVAATATSSARGERIPMSRMRQAIARRLQQSKQTIPHFYVTVAVDMTDAVQVRSEMNKGLAKEDTISMNDLVIRACSIALERVPQVNCKIEDDSLVYLKDINIGVAVSVKDGLVVPVVPEVDTLSLKGIAGKVKEIARLAKEGKQANFTPGTFTISNMGMMNVDTFIAIINPPETAILAF